MEGLKKISLLFKLGVLQGVIPPQERPCMSYLRSFVDEKDDGRLIEKVYQKDPEILARAYSASSMWAANAACLSPSCDTEDNRVHITTANLLSQAHRALEAPQTFKILKRIFPPEERFVHHPPLPDDGQLFDEGAANYLRIAPSHAVAGLEIFVYGKKDDPLSLRPRRYPARQSFESSRTIALTHRLKNNSALFIQQNPAAIDQGVFHNDVISLSNENVFLFHENAFLNTDELVKEIRLKFNELSQEKLHLLKITDNQLTIPEAVSTYFFNSQLVTLPNGSMCLILPKECQAPKTQELIKFILSQGTPIRDFYFVDLAESMRNGGGPACLRLKVVLNEYEEQKIHQGCIVTEPLLRQLDAWINRHYRDELNLDDLRDPQLIAESRQALEELTRILHLEGLYSIQKF